MNISASSTALVVCFTMHTHAQLSDEAPQESGWVPTTWLQKHQSASTSASTNSSSIELLHYSLRHSSNVTQQGHLCWIQHFPTISLLFSTPYLKTIAHNRSRLPRIVNKTQIHLRFDTLQIHSASTKVAEYAQPFQDSLDQTCLLSDNGRIGRQLQLHHMNF